MRNSPLPEFAEQVWGSKKVQVIDHLGPASYSSGGETIRAGDLGFGSIDAVIPIAIAQSGNYQILPVLGTGCRSSFKLIWLELDLTSGNVNEETAATDLSAESVKLMVIGN